jgi:hypothetical protein
MASLKQKKRIIDLVKISPNLFRLKNSIQWKHIPTPIKVGGWRTGCYELEDGWIIIGYSNKVEENLMIGRENQICIMLFHPEEGDCWMHFPIIDEEDYRETYFMWES